MAAGYVAVRACGPERLVATLPVLVALIAQAVVAWSGPGAGTGWTDYAWPVLLATLVLLLVGERGGVTVDRDAGTVETWTDLFLRLATNRHPLADFTRVELDLVPRGTEIEPGATYRVSLAGRRRVNVYDGYEHAALRMEAELLARACGLDVHDLCSGQPNLRPLARLDEPIGERARRHGGVPAPAAPPPPVVRVTATATGARLELPRPGLADGRWFALLAWSAMALAILAQTARLPPAGLPAWKLATLVAVPLFGLTLAVDRAMTRETLEVGPGGFAVERRGLLGARREEVSSGCIEEVELLRQGLSGAGLDPTTVLVAADGRSVTVGLGLRPDELRWLQATLLHYLTAKA